MPQFSDTPPRNPKGVSFQIVRTPAGQPLIGIITSENLVGCFTHFWKRRTMPCKHPECDACKSGIPFRWHAYQSAYLTKTHAHVLFECTAQAAERFVEYREAHGSIRGCLFQASRANSAPNARLIIQCRPADLREIILPNPPDILGCLEILWDFRAGDLKADRTGVKKGQKTVTHHPQEETE